MKRCTRIIYDPTDLTASNNQYNVEYIPAGDTDGQLQEAMLLCANPLNMLLHIHKQPSIQVQHLLAAAMAQLSLMVRQ